MSGHVTRPTGMYHRTSLCGQSVRRGAGLLRGPLSPSLQCVCVCICVCVCVCVCVYINTDILCLWSICAAFSTAVISGLPQKNNTKHTQICFRLRGIMCVSLHIHIYICVCVWVCVCGCGCERQIYEWTS